MPTSASGQSATTNSAPVIPVIHIDNVPLTDAIKNLARHANINYIIDPRVENPVGPDGRPQPQPMVNLRWENVTAEQALAALLKNHDLVMVPSPGAPVTRVSRAGTEPKPSAETPSATTNNAAPLIVMEGMPLPRAIENLAKEAGLNIQLDPRIAAAPQMVSVRWTNLTPHQALLAILDNYELTLQEPTNGVRAIVPKASAAPNAPLPGRRVIDVPGR